MHLIAGQDGEGKEWQVEQEQEQERGEGREVKKWIALVSARVGSVGSRRQARRQAFHLCLNMVPPHQPPQPPSSELYTADETLPSRSCPVLS